MEIEKRRIDHVSEPGIRANAHSYFPIVEYQVGTQTFRVLSRTGVADHDAYFPGQRLEVWYCPEKAGDFHIPRLEKTGDKISKAMLLIGAALLGVGFHMLF